MYNKIRSAEKGKHYNYIIEVSTYCSHQYKRVGHEGNYTIVDISIHTPTVFNIIILYLVVSSITER